MSDIRNALHIKRSDLIGRLEEVRAEHQKAREDKEAEAAKSRESLLDAVRKLDSDQVANIFDHFVSSWSGKKSLEEWVNYVASEDKFKTIPADPTGIETGLDRTIRVLKLASDEEIEVQSSDPVYSYL